MRRLLPGRMRLPNVPAPSRRVVAGALVTGAVLVPVLFWVRDSPIVAVRHVKVTGVSGPQAAQVRQAIRDAAHGMSTLHVDSGRIRAAVQSFPIVESVSVHGDLLHTLDVRVQEHLPVGALVLGSRRVPVAADGTILQGTLSKGLPLVPVGAPPGGSRLVEGRALRLVALLAAAPTPLRARVSRVGYGPHGLTARIAHGPLLYFGPGTRLRAKWIAAARVLADYSSKGATYLDLRVPERPAAGGVVATTAPAPPPAPTAATTAVPTTATTAAAPPAASAPATAQTPTTAVPPPVNSQPQVQPTQ